jgi:hypothetical protein
MEKPVALKNNSGIAAYERVRVTIESIKYARHKKAVNICESKITPKILAIKRNTLPLGVWSSFNLL